MFRTMTVAVAVMGLARTGGAVAHGIAVGPPAFASSGRLDVQLGVAPELHARLEGGRKSRLFHGLDRKVLELV